MKDDENLHAWFPDSSFRLHPSAFPAVHRFVHPRQNRSFRRLKVALGRVNGWNESGRKHRRARPVRALRFVHYLRNPSLPMIDKYRLRSSRVRYFSSAFRLPTIFSNPRRDE